MIKIMSALRIKNTSESDPRKQKLKQLQIKPRKGSDAATVAYQSQMRRQCKKNSLESILEA